MAVPNNVEKLLESIAQDPIQAGIFTNLNTTFKQWYNNKTRLNESNMNLLNKTIQDYIQEITVNLDGKVDNDLNTLISLIAGWKVEPDTVDENGNEVIKGELFNDYANNTAEGQYSSAHGTHTEAKQDNQFVIGQYNDNKTDTLFEVGNGSEGNANNAFEVYKDGTSRLGISDLDNTDIPSYNADDSNNNLLTPKGYVDKKDNYINNKLDEEIDRSTQKDDEHDREIALLKQLNEWLGSISLTDEQMSAWDIRFDSDNSSFTNILTNWVKDHEVDKEGNQRNPRNGDQVTVIPFESGSSTEDVPYPELWMFVENDNDPATTDGTWQFYSSLQELRNASKTIKGLVQIGNNINVKDGLISVPFASNVNVGVVMPRPNGHLIVNAINGELDAKVATRDIHGVVQIGDNIDVSQGIITVPLASNMIAGVVKIGNNIDIDTNGTISVDTNQYWTDWD